MNKSGEKHTIDDLLEIMARLRDPEGGCPWDVQQTFASIAPYTIEEAYEVADAIDRDDMDDLRDELGDLLLQVVFHSQIAAEAGHFDFGDVMTCIGEKMVRRHPHVFGKETAKTPETVRQRWRHIKRNEKTDRPGPAILGSVPKSLPALMRAHRISERAANTGFDWDDIRGVIEKAEEEWAELKQELNKESNTASSESRELEFGDVLFTLVNVARFAGFHPETALASATRKFETRFNLMEKMAQDAQTSFEELSFEEKHRLWDLVKQAENEDQV